ncbi:hypothetical protein J4413_03935 [Candidatus Woesearchaeota archaeon]|nr:hypothetical protein [Candidatus Woesearchaeota archaeon]
MKYLFVLGRDKSLGILEVISFLKARRLTYKIVYSEKKFLILELDKFNFSVEEFGGIIKIGRETSLDKIVIDKNKITYSVYGDKVLNELKKKFKEEKVKAMFRKYSDEPNKNDLELINIEDSIFEMYSISNPKDYKNRDENRPKFDEKKVVSIRLAKILINLSQARYEVLDPFCGCGTILQEGLLKKLDVIGIDKDISDVRANLNWLREKFHTKNNFKVIKGDAGRLNFYLKKVEAIATEPYMGPYLKKLLQEKEAKKIIAELRVLYSNFFEAARDVVKGKLVFIEPIIKIYEGEVSMDFQSLVERSGFRSVKFEEVENPIIYDLKGSKIKRRIWVLERFK